VFHDEAARGFFTGDCFGLSYRELDHGFGAVLLPDDDPGASSIPRRCTPRSIGWSRSSRSACS
jgi:hypothetical protein